MEKAFLDTVASLATKAGVIPPPGSKRMMKYPYTSTAAVGMFPWRYYWNNVWLFKWWFIGWAVSFPLFVKISNLANSPENKQKWKEIRAKEAAEHHH